MSDSKQNSKMVKVQKIKIEKFNLIKDFNDKSNKAMAKCNKYLSEIKGFKIEEYLPKNDKITVSFELNDANTDLANAIRRCLIAEIETIALDFNEYEDLDTSDAYILSDFIKKQINLLRINQDLLHLQNADDLDKYTFSLEKINKTDDIIDVKSSDIKVMYGKEEKNIADFVTTTIVLCRLRPDEYIKINNIKIVKGDARANAGKFNLLANVSYKPLDVQPLQEYKGGASGQSSLVSNPTRFYLSYTTHRNISKPLVVMSKCCDTLIDRLDAILQDVKNISNKDTQYFSTLLELETDNTIKRLKIKGEYWTLINLICRYCYNLTKGNIKLVSPSLIHPDKEIGVINIVHPEFSDLIQDAIDDIIDDLKKIKKDFSAA